MLQKRRNLSTYVWDEPLCSNDLQNHADEVVGQYWGIIATIAMSLAAGLAFLPLRISLYEIFLALHIVLVIVTLVGCWYHIVPHFGFDYGYEVWLYIAFAFWAADRLARLARIAFYNGLASSKAVVEAIPDTNVLQITVFPRDTSGFGPGQHTFLYFIGPGKFWENHPFSVAGWTSGKEPPTGSAVSSPLSTSVSESNAGDQEKRVSDIVTTSRDASPQAHSHGGRASLRFLVRVHSGATATLQRRLSSSSSSGSFGGSPKMEVALYNEGPYGGHRASMVPLYTADTILCLVGGIGITNALGYLQQYATMKNRQRQAGGGATISRGIMKRASRFFLAWTAREMALIRHVERNFVAEVEGIECAFWCTGDAAAEKKNGSVEDGRGAGAANLATVKPGRMDLRTVIRSATEDGRQLAVMVCGPGAMADAATREVVECVKDGLAVRLIVEEFAW
jgi:hypothetical protein